jgi:hypothetical protein
MWIGILISTGYKMVAGGVLVILAGTLVYFLKEKIEKKALGEKSK